MKTCFGGKGGTTHPAFGYGTTGRAHLGRSSFSMVRKCHRRLDGVYVENLDFEDCIKRYDRPHTFFYCDPPYLVASDYIAEFGLEHQRRLAATLRNIKGKFLLSINDHKTIRELYKGMAVRTITTKYTISRDVAAKLRDRAELLISNYRLPK
jgi:DNA adenine methylase